MAENSKIEWTHHTFNPWIGCQKVGPGCDHCYAEAMMDTRLGRVEWGPHAARSRTSPSYWRKPLAWNAAAKSAGQRHRVFCASLADVFDNHASILPEWRDDLWSLIAATPHLDWMLLTKRPGNIANMLPVPFDFEKQYPNVWLGCTVVNQAEADRDIPKLLAVPAAVRFVSMEPLLGPVDLRAHLPQHWKVDQPRRDWASFDWPAWVPDRAREHIEDFWKLDYGRGPDAWLRAAVENGFPPLGTRGEYKTCRNGQPTVSGRVIYAWNNIARVLDDSGDLHVVSGGSYTPRPPRLDLVIVGGESGPGARPMHPDWARSLRDQCVAAGVSYFHKQNGEYQVASYENGHFDSDMSRNNAVWVDGSNGTMHKPYSAGLINPIAMARVGKKAAGRLLDGRTWDQMPGVTNA